MSPLCLTLGNSRHRHLCSDECTCLYLQNVPTMSDVREFPTSSSSSVHGCIECMCVCLYVCMFVVHVYVISGERR